MRYRPTNGNIGSRKAGLCSRIFLAPLALRALDQGRRRVGGKRRYRREIADPGDDDHNHQQPETALTDRAQDRRCRLRLLALAEAVFGQKLAKGFEFRCGHGDSGVAQAPCLHVLMSQISSQKQWLRLFDLRESADVLCCFFSSKEMIVCRPTGPDRRYPRPCVRGEPSSSETNAAFPPAAAVLIVTVCSVANRTR